MGIRRKPAKILDLRQTIGRRRWIVVGDIHGYFDTFMALMDKINLDDEDVLISCGDLVDRGPKVRETVEFFRTRPLTFCVEGNHENKAIRYFKGNPVKVAHGLETTIASYEGREEDQKAFVVWARALPHMIRVHNINGLPAYVVHAGIDHTRPVDKQLREVCLYARYMGGESFRDESGYPWYDKLPGDAHILFGHWMHPGPPDVAPYAWAMDKGIIEGAGLRALVNGQEFIEQENVE